MKSPFASIVQEINAIRGTETIQCVEKLMALPSAGNPIKFDDIVNAWEWGTDNHFFNLLLTAYMPKEYKIIEEITVHFNGGLDSTSFSEGEKKLILLQFILEVLADEETLILLDEPDSHINISRKSILKTLIKKYPSRNNILTTHSPTLMNSFGMDSLYTLGKDDHGAVRRDTSFTTIKQAMEQYTDGLWTIEDQNILQYSTKDILLVEGKSDETFISEALKRLQKTESRFQELEFEYLPCGGADGVKLIMQKFRSKPEQTVIALFDSDGEGWKKINAVFEEENKYRANNFTYKPKAGVYVAAYPIKDGTANNSFMVEDYFPLERTISLLTADITSMNSIMKRDTLKSKMEQQCHDFPDTDFAAFTKLFELILEIKSTTPAEAIEDTSAIAA